MMLPPSAIKVVAHPSRATKAFRYRVSFYDLLVRFHAAGLTDSESGKRLKMSRAAVKQARYRLRKRPVNLAV